MIETIRKGGYLMKRICCILLAVFMLLLCFCGCSKSEPIEEAVSQPYEIVEATPEPTATPEPVEETPAFEREEVELVEDTALRNPLTGEEAEGDMSVIRPYVVMVNNIKVAQPQVGISQADMIYELMEEGGITRMMAFFTDMGSVEKVGSIRSAREYNVSVVHAYDAIFVHAGGSEEALNSIDATGVSDICFVRGRYTGNAFYRDPNRQNHGIEHSLFGTGSLLVQSAADYGYSSEHADGYDGTYGLSFSDAAENQCEFAACQINLTYAGGKQTNFAYHEDTGLYSMEQFGSTYADNYEIDVLFKNVLVINANTFLQSDGLHLTIDLIGSGDGYFCCGGRYTPIKWYRDSLDDSFHYTLEDGTPLALGIGRTFVAVQQVGNYYGTTDFVA